MTIGRARLSRSETVTVAAIEGGVPLLVEAREIVAAFQAIVRKRSLDALDPWLERAGVSLVAPFAHGVLKDEAAVTAAITSPWSNGQTEGQITKLKLVKHRMYGRGKLDLLPGTRHRRHVGPTPSEMPPNSHLWQVISRVQVIHGGCRILTFQRGNRQLIRTRASCPSTAIHDPDSSAMTTPMPAISFPRRRFVQGAAALGAGATLALPSRPAAAAVTGGDSGPPVLRGNRFDLRLDRIRINKSGTETWANAINGIVPGPVLNWREGDVVTINVTNNLPEMTGVHWHGIILPNPMDGVPGLEFPGIMPGETFTYRFPVVQSGTYWYHSHMGYQEQKGVYSALVIDPSGPPMIQAERDYVVVLSDWMDGSPLVVQNNLKHMSDYYNFNRRTVGTFFSDVRQSGLAATAKDRWQWAQMRMDPSGIQEPTGEAFTYLMNGLTSAQNWTGLFHPGERVRLRFINTSAQSFYDVNIPGLTMDVVHVHGNDVVPVSVDQFRIGVAETYDVVVQPREDRAYTIFAQNMSRSGFARGTLATRVGMSAAIPSMDAAPMRNMADMGMTMMPGQVAASHPDHTRLDGIMPSMKGVTAAEKARRAGYQEKLDLPEATKQLAPGVESQYVLDHAFQRLDLPGDGLNHLMGSRRILTYAHLRSVHPGVHEGEPTREIVLTLTGNMGRFIWGFNGKKFSEVGPIDVTLGERFRLRFVNSTMMTHPIHLHGMWMELENGQGGHLPYLHTISVQPAANVSVLVTPIATGQWPLHCHLLYHFEAGMFRTLRVLPKTA